MKFLALRLAWKAYALPKIRHMVVLHVGHLPFAMRRPDSETFTSPVKLRFALHLTQYASPV